MKTLPSDKIDRQLRVVINCMADFSIKGTQPISIYANGQNASVSLAVASAKYKKSGKLTKFSRIEVSIDIDFVL